MALSLARDSWICRRGFVPRKKKPLLQRCLPGYDPDSTVEGAVVMPALIQWPVTQAPPRDALMKR